MDCSLLVYLPGLVLGGTESLLADAWGVSLVLAIMAIPAAIAVAILRYRLYDIDLIIRKTLLYGALTGLLALVYFGSVVLLQGLFEALTGESSPIIIVISTLLIAALFAPLRRRLQGAIDRRFFRQKYDAQQVLAQFAETARDEVELEALTAELLRVTRETVQPESVTFWLERASIMTHPSPKRETYFDRSAWLVLLSAMGFVVVVLASTIYILAMPGDGWLMPYETNPQPWPLETFIANWPTPLQEGDLVSAVDGLNIIEDGSGVLVSDPAWVDGGTVVYTLVRDGQETEVDVALGTLDLSGIWRAFWHAMQDSPAEWSWALIGIVVFLLRPRDLAARLLLLIGISHSAVTKLSWAATTISAQFAPPLVYYTQLLTGSFWAWLFFPSLILLVWTFPVRLLPLKRWPRAVPVLLYSLALALTLLTFLTGQIALATLALAGEAFLLFIAFGTAIVDALKRPRDSVARAQTLWIIFGLVLSIGLVLPIYLLAYAGILDPTDFDKNYTLLSPFLSLVLPLSLGIAITRYHLFDITVIIRKTLLYGALTGLLALVYLGAVLLLQTLVEALTGERSPIIIVLSTLLIAALFAPLRHRLQRAIDRRFFRQKYDAQQVLAQFAATARDEVELEALAAELARVTRETVQPESLTIWLREPRS